MPTHQKWAIAAGATHLLGGRELVICPPHNPAFHYNGCRISAPIGSDVQGPTIFWDKPERGWYAIPPVSTRVIPGPEHDQHRDESSSTGPRRIRQQNPCPCADFLKQTGWSDSAGGEPLRAPPLCRSSSACTAARWAVICMRAISVDTQRIPASSRVTALRLLGRWVRGVQGAAWSARTARSVGGHSALRAERHVRNDVPTFGTQHWFIRAHIVVGFLQQGRLQNDS